MPKDRRRGRRPQSHGPARTITPVSQDPGQQAATPPVTATSQKAPPTVKAVASVRQPVLGNPHLAKDLRNIGIVAVVLVVLLVILSIVL